MMAQYEGIAPDDPRLEPYWALAEDLDIPVAIHMGPGAPGEPYGGSRAIALASAVRCCWKTCWCGTRSCASTSCTPAIRCSDDLRALLFTHPQVYVDIGGIVYTEPRRPSIAFLRSSSKPAMATGSCSAPTR